MMRCFDNRLPGVAPLPPPPERRNAKRQLSRDEKRRAGAAQPKCHCGSHLSLVRIEEGNRLCAACDRPPARRSMYHDWYDEARRMYGHDMSDEDLNAIAQALEGIKDHLAYSGAPIVITVGGEE